MISFAILLPLALLALLAVVWLFDPARKKMKHDCHALKNSMTSHKIHTPGVTNRRPNGG